MNNMSFGKFTSVLMLAAAAGAFVPCTRADQLVNTGVPNGSTWAFLASYQSAAAEFSLSSAETITQIDGYIADNPFNVGDPPPFQNDTFYAVGGTIDVTIVEGSSPSGTAVYSGSFAISANQSAAWLGVSGLDTTLGAGQYWVEFSTADATAAIFGNSPHPLPTEFSSNDSPWYVSSDPINIGVQIDGNPATVPETGSVAGLLWLGIAGLVAFSYRRKLAA